MMHTILLDLNKNSANIEASALISKDGLVIVAALPEGMDEDNVGAMSAALYSVGSRGAQELAGGAIEQLMVQGSQGYILMTHAGKDALLTIITKTNIELEYLFLELKQAAEKIMRHL